MPGPNLQLQGGAFQDLKGNVLSNGSLTFQLSHDASYPTGNSEIVAGLVSRVSLDGNGNVPTTPATFIYSNDVLLPSGTYYIVSAFRNDGAEAWAAPQRWAFAATPNPLNLGTVVPANPTAPSALTTGATLLLQTNGVNNGSQSLLNLRQGSNITITDGGTGTITVATAGTMTATGGYFIGGASSMPGTSPGTKQWYNGLDKRVAGITFVLPFNITVAKISTAMSGTVVASKVIVGIYDVNGNLLIDSGQFDGSAQSAQTLSITPVTLNAGVFNFVWCTSGGTISNTSFESWSTNIWIGNISGVTTNNAVFNLNKPRFFYAANAYSGTAMPATLGALTRWTADFLVPAVLFEAA